MIDVVVNGTIDRLPHAATPLTNQGNYYHNLLILMGYKKEDLPLADLLRRYHGREGKWLIASPVHWIATHNDAMITAATQELKLSDEESRLWFKEVANFLKTDGFDPIYHDAETWLIHVSNKPAIQSQTIDSILHQSLMPLLANLDTSLYWQRLFTEMQMFLSNHSLNATREEHITINGLWFWGEEPFLFPSGRSITTDDEQLLAFAGEKTNLTPLTTTSHLNKNHLVLIKHPETIQQCHLEEKTQEKRAQWYWNNGAYASGKLPWWSKLSLW